MESRQIDKKSTKQVRIDSGYHKLLKLESAELGNSIKGIVEGLLVEYFEVKRNDKSKK